MEQESHLPKDITFCLFRGLDGSQSAAVKAIASFGYTPKIFTSALDFLTHCMVISGLDPDDFGRVVAKKMDDIYGTITHVVISSLLVSATLFGPYQFQGALRDHQ